MTQFVDQVLIKIKSGDGGNGLIAWRREKYVPLGGPAGGSGGRGGNVYLRSTPNLSTLMDFRYQSSFQASSGARGGPKSRQGKAGEDLIIAVPLGTVVLDFASGETIADLTQPDESVLVAEGGHGGRGNKELATGRQPSPYHAEPGQPGIERELKLTLKLIADVGIVGLPNAGKSTLLSVMTRARPKIADYPFSTLTPNLGVVRNPSGDGYVLADLPGLVEGAAHGVGLGHTFLRHVERTRILVHLVDITQEELVENIKTINQELKQYNPELHQLPQILALNKSDLIPPQESQRILRQLKNNLSELLPGSSASPENLVAVSCASGLGIGELTTLLSSKLDKLPPRERSQALKPDLKAFEHPDEGFQIIRQKKTFLVKGDRAERLASVTDMRSPESVHHLYQVLRGMGVIDALIQEGAVPGSTVVLGEAIFSFGQEFSA